MNPHTRTQTDARIDALRAEIDRLRHGRHTADKHVQQLMLKLTEVQLNLAVQDKTLNKLDASVNGNGRPGLLTRLDRVERLAAGLTRAVWLLTAAAVTAAVKFLIDRLG
jgi:hypothetical protein